MEKTLTRILSQKMEAARTGDPVSLRTRVESNERASASDQKPAVPDLGNIATKLRYMAVVKKFRRKYLARLARRWVFRPSSPFRLGWDISQVFLLAYIGFIVPVQLTFNAQSYGWLFAVDTTVDLYFLIDIFMNFNTAYIEPYTEQLVTNRFQIAKAYLRGWFVIDFVTAFPAEYIFRMAQGSLWCAYQAGACAGDASSKVMQFLKFYRLLRLIKIVRLAKIAQLLEKYQHELLLWMPVLNCTNLFAVLLFAGHVAGCIFYYFSSSRWPGEGEVLEYGIMDRWIDVQFDYTSHITDATTTVPEFCSLSDSSGALQGECDIDGFYSIVSRYVASLYWAFTTFTTVGYGDISAKLTSSRGTAVVGMIIGGSMFTGLIGRLSRLLFSADSSKAREAEDVEKFSLFCTDYHLPAHLSVPAYRTLRQLDKSSQHKGNVSRLFSDASILHELPNELRSSILMYMFGDLLRSVKFMSSLQHSHQDSSEMIFTDICSRLEPCNVDTGSILYAMGEQASMLYIHVKGRLEVLDLDEKTVLSTISTPGEVFGEGVVLKVIRRTETVRACTISLVVSISKQALRDACDRHPELQVALDAFAEDTRQRQRSLGARDSLKALKKAVRLLSNPSNKNRVSKYLRPTATQTVAVNTWKRASSIAIRDNAVPSSSNGDAHPGHEDDTPKGDTPKGHAFETRVRRPQPGKRKFMEKGLSSLLTQVSYKMKETTLMLKGCHRDVKKDKAEYSEDLEHIRAMSMQTGHLIEQLAQEWVGSRRGTIHCKAPIGPERGGEA